MSLPEKHFIETLNLLKKIDKTKIGKWLLEQGYYPEQYVVPPSFRVEKFDLLSLPARNRCVKNKKAGLCLSDLNLCGADI